MPRPLALVSPETGKPYPLNDVRRIAFGDPEAFAAGRPVNLVPQYPDGTFTTEAFLNAFTMRRGVWDFQALLPVDAETPPVSIGEGNTPLVSLPYGHGNLMLKDESRNATWSHKDRAMTVALTVARSFGFRTTVGASTGNAGAALAAYSARAGMRCVMFTGTDAPSTMQTLMQVYGAMLCLVPGSISRRGAAKIGLEQYGWWPGTNVTDPPVGSNTYGIEGYATIAYELVRDLGDAPAAVVVPTSYGDILTGLWRGFTRMHTAGIIARLPRLIVAEPANAAPYGPALGAAAPPTIHATPTAAFSIGGGTASLQGLQVLTESGGTAIAVGEADILPMQAQVAREAGVYLEAASVVGIVAARQVATETDGLVVVIGTSTGLKDPAATARTLPTPPTIPVDVNALIAALRDTYGVNADDLRERGAAR